jgi:hypothetical protein
MIHSARQCIAMHCIVTCPVFVCLFVFLFVCYVHVSGEGGEEPGQCRFLTLCAHPSGRTLGGASWVIRQGEWRDGGVEWREVLSGWRC